MGKLETKQFELAEINTSLEQIPNYDWIAKMVKDKTKLEKEIKKIKKDAVPKWLETDDSKMVSIENVEESEIDELIDQGISLVQEHLMEYDHDEIPDGEMEWTSHFLVGDRMFEVVVEYETEWVGDWSMRCNIIPSRGDYRVIKKTEIKDFEVTWTDGEGLFNAKYLAVK